jgi:hypothetical protein
MLTGGCHCGNLTVRFDTMRAESLPIRECQCSFCRRHAARNVSDPEGQLTITVQDAAELSRYRFGKATADFLLCRRCGVYVAAYLAAGDSGFATVNTNVLTDGSAFARAAEPVSYDDEDLDARIARRRRRWTPAALSVPSR